MKAHALLLSSLALAALTSCAQPVPPAAATPASPASPASAEPESARLASELRALIGPATCSASSQCRALPVGAKACGGPAGFLAWSTEGSDAARIADVAARQTAAQRRELERSGMRSDCRVVADPGAACVAGRCQLTTPADAR